MSVKFKASTQWYKLFYVATAVYYIERDQKYRLVLTYMNEII